MPSFRAISLTSIPAKKSQRTSRSMGVSDCDSTSIRSRTQAEERTVSWMLRGFACHAASGTAGTGKGAGRILATAVLVWAETAVAAAVSVSGAAWPSAAQVAAKRLRTASKKRFMAIEILQQKLGPTILQRIGEAIRREKNRKIIKIRRRCAASSGKPAIACNLSGHW